MLKKPSKVDPLVTRWKARFQHANQSLNALLARLDPCEVDWTPDEGMESIRDHLWAIAESERWLTVRLARGKITPVQKAYRASDVDFREITRMLEICHGNLNSWMATTTAAAILDEPPGRDEDPEHRGGFCVEDLLYHHLEFKAVHTSAIRSLIRLIDPVRCGAH
ncbi:MAG: DinB family protein [Planctomycetes bacterium]|nr:DinB family protein [Planctomycetota bacterium]